MDNKTILGILPPEIVVSILSYVRAHSLVTIRMTRLRPIRLVSKDFRYFVDLELGLRCVLPVNTSKPLEIFTNFLASVT
jgi:hypothetical protein